MANLAEANAIRAQSFINKTRKEFSGAHIALALANAQFRDWETAGVPVKYRDYGKLRDALTGTLRKIKETNDFARFQSGPLAPADSKKILEVWTAAGGTPPTPGQALMLNVMLNYGGTQYELGKRADATAKAQDLVLWAGQRIPISAEDTLLETFETAQADPKFAREIDAVMGPIVGFTTASTKAQILAADPELALALKGEEVSALLEEVKQDQQAIEKAVEKGIGRVVGALEELQKQAGEKAKAAATAEERREAERQAAIAQEQSFNDMRIGLRLAASILTKMDPANARVISAAVSVADSVITAYKEYGASLSAFGAYGTVAVAVLGLVESAQDGNSSAFQALSDQIAGLADQVREFEERLNSRLDKVDERLVAMQRQLNQVLDAVLDTKAITEEALNRIIRLQDDVTWAQASEHLRLADQRCFEINRLYWKCAMPRSAGPSSFDENLATQVLSELGAYAAGSAPSTAIQFRSFEELDRVWARMGALPSVLSATVVEATLEFLASEVAAGSSWTRRSQQDIATWLRAAEALATIVVAWNTQLRPRPHTLRAIVDRVQTARTDLGRVWRAKEDLLLSQAGMKMLLARYRNAVERQAQYHATRVNKLLASWTRRYRVHVLEDGSFILGAGRIDAPLPVGNERLQERFASRVLVSADMTAPTSRFQVSGELAPPPEMGALLPSDLLALQYAGQVEIHFTKVDILAVPPSEREPVDIGGGQSFESAFRMLVLKDVPKYSAEMRCLNIGAKPTRITPGEFSTWPAAKPLPDELSKYFEEGGSPYERRVQLVLWFALDRSFPAAQPWPIDPFFAIHASCLERDVFGLQLPETPPGSRSRDKPPPGAMEPYPSLWSKRRAEWLATLGQLACEQLRARWPFAMEKVLERFRLWWPSRAANYFLGLESTGIQAAAATARAWLLDDLRNLLPLVECDEESERLASETEAAREMALRLMAHFGWGEIMSASTPMSDLFSAIKKLPGGGDVDVWLKDKLRGGLAMDAFGYVSGQGATNWVESLIANAEGLRSRILVRGAGVAQAEWLRTGLLLDYAEQLLQPTSKQGAWMMREDVWMDLSSRKQTMAVG